MALDAVDGVIKAIGASIRTKAGSHAVVMRSTVPLPLLEQASGGRLGDGVSYYSNPEFLREGSSVRDFRSPPFTLIGAPAGEARLLREIYAGIDAPVHIAPLHVAESLTCFMRSN